MLNIYSYNGIARVTAQMGDTITYMYNDYPYERYFFPYFKKLCYKYAIRQCSYLYQECYDAGMLAYMYSICRCSVMKDKGNAEHVKAYIWKLVRIYFIAAIVIEKEFINVCREKGYKQVDCNDYRV